MMAQAATHRAQRSVGSAGPQQRPWRVAMSWSAGARDRGSRGGPGLVGDRLFARTARRVCSRHEIAGGTRAQGSGIGGWRGRVSLTGSLWRTYGRA
jgi:hypothetical protein